MFAEFFHNQILALLDTFGTNVIVAAFFTPEVLFADVDRVAAYVATRRAVGVVNRFEDVALVARWWTFSFNVAIAAVVVVAVFVSLSAAVVAVLAHNVCTANITANCIPAVVRISLPWLGPALDNVSLAAGLSFAHGLFTGKAF